MDTRAPPPPSAGSDGAALLRIEDLRVSFATERGVARSVNGVTLEVQRGQTLGIVGESGSGKSVTAQTILRLIPRPPGRIDAGRILWKGRDLLSLSERALAAVRTREIAIVFQEPMTALNPVYTVGEQLAEVLRVHERLSRRAALERAAELLDMVHIPNAAQRVRDYPHQFSGGMRQRVLIAMAISCSPQLLIADEPTTSLDVTIQAQILELLAEMRARLGMSVLLITHAMGVVAEVADRVVVMYAGRVVEDAPVQALFEHPRHPYTRGLIASIPGATAPAARGAGTRARLHAIPGTVPNPVRLPSGCAFAQRCAWADKGCRISTPPLLPIAAGHLAACFKT